MGDEELLEKVGLTAREADVRAAEYESDAWDASALGRPRRGRPSIADEEVRPYTVRFPVSLMEFVDAEARNHGRSRSEELRCIVAHARERGSSGTRERASLRA